LEYTDIAILFLNEYGAIYKNMQKTECETLSEIFKALSHPLRVQIVMGLIQKHECNVSTMVEKLGVPQPTVSQHINILKNAGIIEGYRKGNQICYKVTNELAKTLLKDFSQEIQTGE